jgi:uncharacterized protein YfaS (alpha-2-macroglobulin family)
MKTNQVQGLLNQKNLINSFVVMAASTFLGASFTQAAEVVSFWPVGSVKSVQQVTVRFSDDMIAMGDPRAKADPFEVNCTGIKGYDKKNNESIYKTRWADSKNWVLDFQNPLQSGAKCDFQLKSVAKDLNGKPVKGLQSYSFTTSGPSILTVAPTYGHIDPEQYFVLQLEGSVNALSVNNLAYFEVSSFPDKVGVTIVEGNDKTTVIEAAVKSQWQWRSLRDLLRASKGTPLQKLPEFDNFIVLSAQRRFPDGATVKLHWPNGILSKSGLAVTEAQSFDFQVVPAFQATFSCDRDEPTKGCNPILDMRVQFSSEVPVNFLKGVQIKSESGQIWRPLQLEKINNKDEQNQTLSYLSFSGPFPEKTKFQVIFPTKIRDRLNRSLTNENKFPLSVSTDEYSPLVKFSAAFGILEWKADPILPVSVRNVEATLKGSQRPIEAKSISLGSESTPKEIINWINKTKSKSYSYDDRNSSIFGKQSVTEFQLPKPNGEREFELIGIPLKNPGFYVVELQSLKLGQTLTDEKAPMYVATTALVTDMAVHLKIGRESSLVWVTQLSNAKPVSNATVHLVNSNGETIVSGNTNKQGLIQFVSPKLPCRNSENEYSNESSSDGGDPCAVYAFAKSGDDVSFVSSEWQDGIENYRFSVDQEYLDSVWGPSIAHTILDRMVAQPGDKIQMKHILRARASNGFEFINPTFKPKTVYVVHEGSRKSYPMPFDFNADTSSALNVFQVPKDASLGTYGIYLSKQNAKGSESDSSNDNSNGGDNSDFDWNAKSTGQFVVSQYRLPLMKANIKILDTPLVNPKIASADLSLGYLSGGPASQQRVKLRSSVTRSGFKPSFPDSDDYSFLSQLIVPGTFSFDDETEDKTETTHFVDVQNLTLNKDGGFLAKVPQPKADSTVRSLSVEMEYSDPNGEIKTAEGRATIFPSEQFVGLRIDNWYTKSDAVKLQGIVTDISGTTISNKQFVVDAFLSKYISHRKKLVGGFYSYDSKKIITALGKVCQGTTDSKGRFVCEPKGLPAGSILLQAKIFDDKQNPSFAVASVSVTQKQQDAWWAPSDSDRIDLIPEKKSFAPNELAKFVLRSPFPVSQVLVTVEREGILDSFVTEVKRDSPSIEIQMKGHYAPNVYVSAVAIRGRVNDPKPTALVDLGRPSMKMGMTEVKVGWGAHKLDVAVTTNKPRFETKEKVETKIKVTAPNGKTLPKNSEVSVAVVDEALMRLKENSSWNLLDAMMGKRPLSVRTSSGQNQVVGKRHFGQKAKPIGGGGGQMAADPRDMFEPVVLWLPNQKLDKNGELKLDFVLNDSITSFRIVAVATGDAQMFGSGNTTIEVNKNLILYSGIAPMMRQGDVVQASITARNTTTTPMSVLLTVQSSNIKSLPKLDPIALKANESRTISVPLVIPQGISSAEFMISAKDQNSKNQDSLLVKSKIEPAVAVQVLQATLFQLEKPQKIPVQQPADNISGQGGIKIKMSESLVTGLTGVKSYMRDYPYSCLEQKTSKAIVSEDKEEIQGVVSLLPSYIDEIGLLRFFPSSLCGSSSLTAYVLSILHENSVSIPETIKTSLLSGIKSALMGNESCGHRYSWNQNNTNPDQLKILLMEVLSRYGQFEEKQLALVRPTPNLWGTSTLVSWHNLFEREKNLPDRDKILKQTQHVIRSRLNFQGSIMNLQDSVRDFDSWTLMTSQDHTALMVFKIALSDKEFSDDVGRLARGVIARIKRGRWDTSIANAWGVTLFNQFANKFENEKVAGATTINTKEQSEIVDWKTKNKNQLTNLKWPSGREADTVNFQHNGSGKPWVHLETLAALPLKKPLDMGYQILKSTVAVVQKSPDTKSAGDVYNVVLKVTAKTDQMWVVVNDPIPAGATILGTGLDGSSKLLDQNNSPKNSQGNEMWPEEYNEKSFSSFLSYAAYLPRGTYEVSYRIRLNSAGTFKIPNTRVEAMYSPESFGEIPNANWTVVP